MRQQRLIEAWPLAIAALAGVAVFLVVRLLLPSGEEALSVGAIGPEPPSPVYSVAVPEPAESARPEPRPETAFARTISAPFVVRQTPASTKPAARHAQKPRVVAKPKPSPQPQPAPAPTAPAPEPVRTLASVVRIAAPVTNHSPGRAKHDSGPPPGQAKQAEQEKPRLEVAADGKTRPAPHVKKPKLEQAAEPAVALEVPSENPSPGREKHDDGLPPGQEKKNG